MGRRSSLRKPMYLCAQCYWVCVCVFKMRTPPKKQTCVFQNHLNKGILKMHTHTMHAPDIASKENKEPLILPDLKWLCSFMSVVCSLAILRQSTVFWLRLCSSANDFLPITLQGKRHVADIFYKKLHLLLVFTDSRTLSFPKLPK